MKKIQRSHHLYNRFFLDWWYSTLASALGWMLGIPSILPEIWELDFSPCWLGMEQKPSLPSATGHTFLWLPVICEQSLEVYSMISWLDGILIQKVKQRMKMKTRRKQLRKWLLNKQYACVFIFEVRIAAFRAEKGGDFYRFNAEWARHVK